LRAAVSDELSPCAAGAAAADTLDSKNGNADSVPVVVYTTSVVPRLQMRQSIDIG
jgi:hypothetical protein